MAQTAIRLRVSVRISGLVDGDNGARLVPILSYSESFVNGSDDRGVTRAYQELAGTVTNGTNEIALQTGTDFEGTALGLTKARLVALQNTGSNEILFTQANSDSIFQSGVAIQVDPGGFLLGINPGAAGWAVDSDDIALRMTSSATDRIDYDLLVVGS
ncbi:MAG: hypothetical protein AAFV53_31760 [Myxococcota bacterium]